MTLNEIFENEIIKENKKLEMTYLIKTALKKTEGNFCFQREKGNQIPHSLLKKLNLIFRI